MSTTPAPFSILDYIKDATRRYIARGKYYLEDSAFVDGAIYNARIDMNNKRIKNVGQPRENGDAVPYGLFAAVTAEFEPYELTDTNVTTYANSPEYGTYFINVRPQVEGGPTALWCLSRPSAACTSCLKNVVASAVGDDDLETTLDVSWPPNAPIMIWKSSSNFDGVYEIKISRC